jgi:hypothetical protein
MIRSMRFEGTTYLDIPWRFEAGTPAIAAVVGLGASITWLESIGFEAIAAHERTLTEHALRVFPTIRGLQLFAPPVARVPVFAFTLAGVHAHDVGTVLDQDGIAIRTGHHCAQPLMEHLGVGAVARASLALYNTTGEIDALVESLDRVARMFRRWVRPAAMTMAAVIGASRHIVWMWITYDEMRSVTASASGSFHSLDPPTRRKSKQTPQPTGTLTMSLRNIRAASCTGARTLRSSGDRPDGIRLCNVTQQVPEERRRDKDVEGKADAEQVALREVRPPHEPNHIGRTIPRP